jgi:hypothetical protein
VHDGLIVAANTCTVLSLCSCSVTTTMNHMPETISGSQLGLGCNV